MNHSFKPDDNQSIQIPNRTERFVYIITLPLVNDFKFQSDPFLTQIYWMALEDLY